MNQSNETTGLHASIYRNAQHGDCSNGGISSRVDAITIVSAHINAPHSINDRHPEFHVWARVWGGLGGQVRTVSADDLSGPDLREPNCYLFLVPAGEKPHAVMMGGNYAGTPDSRFSEAFGSRPLPIHDRKEGRND